MEKMVRLYKVLGVLISFCALSISILCFDAVKFDIANPFLHQSIVSILIPLICFIRFIYGKKKGHPIIFCYALISLIISMETYCVIDGGLAVGMEFIVGFIVIFSSIVLSRILRKFKDANYFEKLDCLWSHEGSFI
jgi:hypothetical protein